jgi:integrase
MMEQYVTFRGNFKDKANDWFINSGNPRLKRINFHPLRHWRATRLYHQTKDILYVMQFLGHRNIKKTLIYVQLEETLFKMKTSNSYTRLPVRLTR